MSMSMIYKETKPENHFILDIFQDESRKNLASVLENIKTVPLGMSEFQINHFVLNGIDFPTDWAKFQQIKLQLHLGIGALVDMYFQIQEAHAIIDLAKGQIEELENGVKSKVSSAKQKLRQINIEKNEFKINSVKQIAYEKLREIMDYYALFQNLQKFNSITLEESKQLEEETWKIRAMYNPEFKNRYGLSPDGFLKLPHENKIKGDIQ